MKKIKSPISFEDFKKIDEGIRSDIKGYIKKNKKELNSLADEDEWDTIYDPYLSKKIKSTKSSNNKKKKNIKIKTEKYKKPKDALLTGVCLISDDD